jgi:acyl carrier protein
MALSKERLLRFVEDQLGVDTADLAADTLLFSSGMIDSASMVDLIVFLESEGYVKFAPDDITLDHLDSIGRILDFVAGNSHRGRHR